MDSAVSATRPNFLSRFAAQVACVDFLSLCSTLLSTSWKCSASLHTYRFICYCFSGVSFRYSFRSIDQVSAFFSVTRDTLSQFNRSSHFVTADIYFTLSHHLALSLSQIDLPSYAPILKSLTCIFWKSINELEAASNADLAYCDSHQHDPTSKLTFLHFEAQRLDLLSYSVPRFPSAGQTWLPNLLWGQETQLSFMSHTCSVCVSFDTEWSPIKPESLQPPSTPTSKRSSTPSQAPLKI